MSNSHLDFIRSETPSLLILYNDESDMAQEKLLLRVAWDIAYKEGDYTVAIQAHKTMQNRLITWAVAQELGVKLNDLDFCRIRISDEPWKSRVEDFFGRWKQAEATVGHIRFVRPRGKPKEFASMLFQLRRQVQAEGHNLVFAAFEYNFVSWLGKWDDQFKDFDLIRQELRRIAELHAVPIILVVP